MSLSSGGILTIADDLIIGDGKTIGSASDVDAMSIAAGGAVTFTQTPVFPDGSLALADLDIDGGTDIGADLNNADLFIVDDGAGGTNRKAAMTRIKTYIGQGGVGNAAFFAYLNAHQNVANTTAVTVAFNAELIDTQNGFNTSTYKYTIPSGQGGYWHIGATIRKNNFKSDRSLMILTKNSGATINDIEGGGGTLYGGPSGSVVDELSAGDVIYVAYYHNAGDNKQIYATSATDSCHFWGYKLTV